MKDEIKEILDDLRKTADNTIFVVCSSQEKLDKMPRYTANFMSINDRKAKLLLNYITNLQKENERLKEKIKQYEDPEDLTLFYMWLDEKVKDKMKQLQEENKNLKQINEEHRRINGELRKTINKAIEKCINKQYETNAPWLIKFAKDIENILQGSDE